MGQRAEVALEAAPLARAGQVVEDPEPEGAAACHGHGEGGVGAKGPFGRNLTLTFAVAAPGRPDSRAATAAPMTSAVIAPTATAGPSSSVTSSPR